MRIAILAVGRLKPGAETDLVDRYLQRGQAIGRQLGVSLAVSALPESRAVRAQDRASEEAAALLRHLPADGLAVAMDAGGELMTSEAFAAKLDTWRNGSVRDLVFLIGGADGLGGAARARAHLTLSFGRMTWPHQLVRAMLLEQIYRAATILTNHPYHRGGG